MFQANTDLGEDTSKDTFPLRKGWQWITGWQLDLNRAVNDGGWQFAIDADEGAWVASERTIHVVRRRRWVRTRERLEDLKEEQKKVDMWSVCVCVCVCACVCVCVHACVCVCTTFFYVCHQRSSIAMFTLLFISLPPYLQSWLSVRRQSAKAGSMPAQSSAHTTSLNTDWTLHEGGVGTANWCKSPETRPQSSTLIQRCRNSMSAHEPINIPAVSFVWRAHRHALVWVCGCEQG